MVFEYDCIALSNTAYDMEAHILVLPEPKKITSSQTGNSCHVTSNLKAELLTHRPTRDAIKTSNQISRQTKTPESGLERS